jgi:hypothetical protein
MSNHVKWKITVYILKSGVNFQAAFEQNETCLYVCRQFIMLTSGGCQDSGLVGCDTELLGLCFLTY